MRRKTRCKLFSETVNSGKRLKKDRTTSHAKWSSPVCLIYPLVLVTVTYMLQNSRNARVPLHSLTWSPSLSFRLFSLSYKAYIPLIHNVILARNSRHMFTRTFDWNRRVSFAQVCFTHVLSYIHLYPNY